MKTLHETHDSIQELSKAHKEQRILSAENVYQSEIDLINNWFIEGKEAIQKNLISQLKRKLDLLYGEQQSRSLFQRKRQRPQIDDFDIRGRKRARKTPTSLWNAHFMRFMKSFKNDKNLHKGDLNSSFYQNIQNRSFEENSKNIFQLSSSNLDTSIENNDNADNVDHLDNIHVEKEKSESNNSISEFYHIQNTSHSNIYLTLPSLSGLSAPELNQDVSELENILSSTEKIVDDEEDVEEIKNDINIEMSLDKSHEISNQYPITTFIPSEQYLGKDSLIRNDGVPIRTDNIATFRNDNGYQIRSDAYHAYPMNQGDVRIVHSDQYSKPIVHFTSNSNHPPPPPPEVSPSVLPPNPNINLLSYHFPPQPSNSVQNIFPHQVSHVHPHGNQIFQQGQLIPQSVIHTHQGPIIQPSQPSQGSLIQHGHQIHGQPIQGLHSQQIHGQRGVPMGQFETSRIYPSIPPGSIPPPNLHPSRPKQSPSPKQSIRPDVMEVQNSYSISNPINSNIPSSQNYPQRIPQQHNMNYGMVPQPLHSNLDAPILPQPKQGQLIHSSSGSQPSIQHQHYFIPHQTPSNHIPHLNNSTHISQLQPIPNYYETREQVIESNVPQNSPPSVNPIVETNSSEFNTNESLNISNSDPGNVQKETHEQNVNFIENTTKRVLTQHPNLIESLETQNVEQNDNFVPNSSNSTTELETNVRIESQNDSVETRDGTSSQETVSTSSVENQLEKPFVNSVIEESSESIQISNSE